MLLLGIGKSSTADRKALTEVLRKLTSSVSCALDEAAQALHRMRAEQQGQIAGAEGLVYTVTVFALISAKGIRIKGKQRQLLGVEKKELVMVEFVGG